MASFLTTLFVICALVLFAVFFVIFKLIWLLRKQKRNFWPLVLSGCCTAVCLVICSVAVYQFYNHFMQPLHPILAAVNTGQKIQGVQTFTDPQQAFTLQTQDGIVMSNWINYLPYGQFLIGLDINSILETNANARADSFNALLINHQTQNEFVPAAQLFQEKVFPVIQSNPKAAKLITIEQTLSEISVGENASAAYVHGVLHSEKTTDTLPIILFVATRGTDAYYILGTGSHITDDTVTSFRFLN